MDRITLVPGQKQLNLCSTSEELGTVDRVCTVGENLITGDGLQLPVLDWQKRGDYLSQLQLLPGDPIVSVDNATVFL